MGGSSYSNVDCDEVSVSATPSRKQELLKFELLSFNTDLPPSCDGDNSSVNEGCESPFSSWDSEPETDIPSLINRDGMPEGSLQSINLEENYLGMEEQNQFVGVENTDDGLLWEMDNRIYEELLKKFKEKEEELRVSNFKLHNSEAQLDNVCEELQLKEEELNNQKELSEEEIFNLKIQIEKSENRLDNVNGELKRKEEELKIQKELLKKAVLYLNRLNNVNEEFKLKEEALNKQKVLSEEEIFKLKTEIEKSEIQLNNVNEELKLKKAELNKQKEFSEEDIFKLKTLIEESEIQLKVTQENMDKLEFELVSELEANETNHEQEVQKLKSEMLDSRAKFSLEKNKLHFDIASLSKMKIELTSKLEDCDSRNKSLENKLKQYEAEKLNQLELRATQDEIMSLRQELKQRMDDAEATNKKLDMVMIELDEANVMIAKSKAEIRSRDGKILKMKKYTDDVKTSLRELMDDYNTALNEVNNLKPRVAELENEVTRQNGVILDMAMANKEALRQVHEHYESKLEIYKTAYNELLQKSYR